MRDSPIVAQRAHQLLVPTEVTVQQLGIEVVLHQTIPLTAEVRHQVGITIIVQDITALIVVEVLVPVLVPTVVVALAAAATTEIATGRGVAHPVVVVTLQVAQEEVVMAELALVAAAQEEQEGEAEDNNSIQTSLA